MVHFLGQEAITRPTRGSGRTLVSLSFVVWFVKFSDAPIENLVISGVQILESSEATYGFVHWVVLLALLAYHIVNWFGDWQSYKGWNVRDKITMTAGFGPDAALVSKIEKTLHIVRNNIGSKGKEGEIVLQRLDEIKNEVCRLNSFACWYIWLWGVVPFLCCAIALGWQWIDP